MNPFLLISFILVSVCGRQINLVDEASPPEVHPVVVQESPDPSKVDFTKSSCPGVTCSPIPEGSKCEVAEGKPGIYFNAMINCCPYLKCTNPDGSTFTHYGAAGVGLQSARVEFSEGNGTGPLINGVSQVQGFPGLVGNATSTIIGTGNADHVQAVTRMLNDISNAIQSQWNIISDLNLNMGKLFKGIFIQKH